MEGSAPSSIPLPEETVNRILVLLASAAISLLLPFAARPARGVVNEPEPWEERFFTVLLGGEERDAYENLPEPERAEWRRIYWSVWDPTPTTETNEHEREHQDRVVRAIRDFRDEGDRFIWDDRAQAAIRFGFPERVDDFADRVSARVVGAVGLVQEEEAVVQVLARQDGDGIDHRDQRRGAARRSSRARRTWRGRPRRRTGRARARC